MIRTRDLVLFVATLFFLGVGIAVTLLKESGLPFSMETVLYFNPSQDASSTFGAQGTQTEINRDDVITRLRNALALDNTEVEPNPSVESPSAEMQAEEDADDSSGVQRCGDSDDAAVYAQSWPLTGVSIITAGSMREVVHTETSGIAVVDVNASSTASTSAGIQSIKKTLIAFPQFPAGGQTHCVPSDVVGVTISGSLMFNNDAPFYRGYGPEYLIGYARDGFPIYGYYEGQVDACGGYMHASGYRYAVSPDRDHVIGCFSAAPSSFK